MSDATGAAPDAGDEQAIAEELDDDRFREDGSGGDASDDDGAVDYPPDHAFASLEASGPITTGDVPQDSLEERLWREEPDVLPPPDDAVDLLERHPDGGYDADFAEESAFELAESTPDDGELLGQAVDPGAVRSAEEAAVHVVDEPPGARAD